MLEGEGAGLAARVAELEIKCARQAEELLCLRSTLADALRRLNALEGRAPTAPSTQRNGAYTGETNILAAFLRISLTDVLWRLIALVGKAGTCLIL